jgi:hypothetical protein
MSRLRSCKQTTNGASPLRIRDFRNVAEVDFFIRHCSQGFEFFFLFLSRHTSPFRWTCFSCRNNPDHFIAVNVLNRVGDRQNHDAARASEALPAFLAFHIPFSVDSQTLAAVPPEPALSAS